MPYLQKKCSLTTTLTLITTLILSGCAGGIVKKPEIDSVKKIGIVSVYSNAKLHYFKSNLKKGEAASIEVDSPFESAAGALQLGKALQNTIDHSSTVLDYARNSAEKEFSRLTRFQLIPFETFRNSAAYHSFATNTGQPLNKNKPFSLGSFISTPSTQWNFATGMRAAEKIRANVYPNETVKELANLANQLDLDGVIVLRFELGYKDPQFSIHAMSGILSGNTGKAEASVAATLTLVTRKGNLGIVTPDFKDGAGKRATSDKTFLIISGKAQMNEETKEAMQEAIEKTLINLREQISKEL